MSKRVNSFVSKSSKTNVTAGNDNQPTCTQDAKNKETQQSSLSNKTGKSGQNRASTPVLGQKAASFFEPDISHINGSQASAGSDSKSGSNTSISKATSLPSLMNITKNDANKNKLAAATQKTKQKLNADLQREFENLKARYIQTFTLCQMQEKQNKKETSKLEEMLEQLQKKIAEDRRVLDETKENIKEIKINCELEKIHKLQTTVYEQVLGKLDASNCDVSLKETTKLLEYYQDKLPVKDIEVPDQGLKQLETSMKKVIESVKNLSSKHDFEVYSHLGKANIGLKDCEEIAERCKQKLKEVKTLKLKEACLKLDDGKSVDDVLNSFIWTLNSKP